MDANKIYKNSDFISETNLNNSFIIGYYGGGNFGDELLLEVLQNLFKKNNTSNIKFYYTADNYETFHKDFGYKKVNPANKFSFFQELIKSKNIIIGGGGIWGLDFNNNIYILSILLFICRFFLQKNVYLLGIGYYSSTTKKGHQSAKIAAKASNLIIARDDESYSNFKKLNDETYQDFDLSFNIPQTDKNLYTDDAKELVKNLKIDKKTYIISLRRFNKKFENNYTNIIKEIIKDNPKKRFIVNTFEPKEVDPEGYELIKKLESENKNVTAYFDFNFNPLAYYYFLIQNKSKIVTIAPQFHSIISSYQAGVKFFPFVYDNKVEEVLKQFGVKKYKWINDLEKSDIQQFINNN